MRKTLLLLFLIFIMFGKVSAQPLGNQHIDSMVSMLPSADINQKVSLLQDLGNAMLNTDPAKSIEYAEQGLKLSSAMHDSIRVGFLYTLSMAYGRTGNMTQQLTLGRQAVDIYIRLHDEKRATKAMSLLAMAFYNLGNFEASLRMQLEVLRIRERLLDNKGLAGTWNNLGIVYQRLNQTDDAIKSYEQALTYIDSEKIDYLRGPVLNNLGSLYSSKGKYDEAARALNSAMELHEKMGDTEGLLNTYINFGVLYTNLGKINKAIENYNLAYEISRKSGNRHGVAVTTLNLGVINNQIRNYKEAEKQLLESISISVHEGFRDIEMDGYQNLAGLYNETGEYKKAYEYHIKYSALKDSLFTEEASENMTKMRALYEADKKEQDNILLNQQLEFKQLQLDRRQVTIYLAIFLLFAFLVLSASLYKLYRQNRKALTRELEMNRLISRFVSTVSHEFRTPLAGISSSMQLLRDYKLDLDPKEQERLYGKISDSISHLKSMLDDVTLLEKEQSDRLTLRNESFIFESFCDEVIRDTLAAIPSQYTASVTYEGNVGNIISDKEMMRHVLSNIISNAVKYSDVNGEVKVSATCTGQSLTVEVIDNGRGIPEEDMPYLYNDFYRGSNVEGVPGTGLGMSIVKTSLKKLNGSIELSSVPDEGTTVKVSIPDVLVTTETESNISTIEAS